MDSSWFASSCAAKSVVLQLLKHVQLSDRKRKGKKASSRKGFEPMTSCLEGGALCAEPQPRPHSFQILRTWQMRLTLFPKSGFDQKMCFCFSFHGKPAAFFECEAILQTGKPLKFKLSVLLIDAQAVAITQMMKLPMLKFWNRTYKSARDVTLVTKTY